MREIRWRDHLFKVHMGGYTIELPPPAPATLQVEPARMQLITTPPSQPSAPFIPASPPLSADINSVANETTEKAPTVHAT